MSASAGGLVSVVCHAAPALHQTGDAAQRFAGVDAGDHSGHDPVGRYARSALYRKHVNLAALDGKTRRRAANERVRGRHHARAAARHNSGSQPDERRHRQNPRATEHRHTTYRQPPTPKTRCPARRQHVLANDQCELGTLHRVAKHRESVPTRPETPAGSRCCSSRKAPRVTTSAGMARRRTAKRAAVGSIPVGA